MPDCAVLRSGGPPRIPDMLLTCVDDLITGTSRTGCDPATSEIWVLTGPRSHIYVLGERSFMLYPDKAGRNATAVRLDQGSRGQRRRELPDGEQGAERWQRAGVRRDGRADHGRRRATRLPAEHRGPEPGAAVDRDDRPDRRGRDRHRAVPVRRGG